jgi:hypothetical protein
MEANLFILNHYSDASSALRGLTERLSDGKPEPSEHPTKLSLDSIGVISKLFQPRDMRHDKLQSTYHVESLVRAIYANSTHLLNPVSVWWAGESWVVIDGHHRLDAYKAYQKALRANKTPKGHNKHMVHNSGRLPELQVPVRVLSGTVLEATLHSTAANSQDKLPMSKDSKLTRAWQLVTVDWEELTLKSISKCCAIHNRSVSNMRAVWRKAQATCNEEQLVELKSLSWRQAQHWNKDVDVSPWGDKEIEEETNRLRDILVKTFGKTLLPKAAMFAEALERYSPALARELGIHLKPIFNDWDRESEGIEDNDDWEWEEDEDQ